LASSGRSKKAPESDLAVTDSSSIRAQLRSATSPVLRRRLTQDLQAALLRDQITSCTNCELSQTRTQAVPFTGPTHGRGQIVLVGEAPGQMEDEAGVPFVGRSGALLDKCLEAAGTSRSRVTIINTLACRPPKNANPTPDQLAACRPHFDRQLSLTRTWVGVALGGFALASIMGVDRSSIKISDYLDTPVWVDGRVWFGTYHPSYALRGVIGAKSQIILSIKAALALKLGRGELPPYSDASNQKIRDSDYLTALTAADILGEGKKLASHVQKKGWYFTYHEPFGAHILVIENEDTPYRTTIPAKFASYPRYTIEELIRLSETAVGNGWSKQELRRLHMVKTEFNGKVVA
jgi:uracil-DNA glycosylase